MVLQVSQQILLESEMGFGNNF